MQNNGEIIEKYIDGDLNDNELMDFENLLSTDPYLKRDYNLSLEINNSILEEDVLTLRDSLDFIYQEEVVVKKDPGLFRKPKFYYYAAASVALLIASAGLFQKLNSPSLDTNKVYEEYYAPYDVSVFYRSGDTEVDRLLLTALEHYEERDYEHALVLFEEVLLSREKDMAVKLYSGITYMEEKHYQKAKKSFNKIISNNNNLFIEQAKWYLALCYLKTEKIEDAQIILSEIIKEESYYKQNANEILRSLRN